MGQIRTKPGTRQRGPSWREIREQYERERAVLDVLPHVCRDCPMSVEEAMELTDAPRAQIAAALAAAHRHPHDPFEGL